MIKVYFTASTTHAGEFRDTFKKILTLIAKQRVEIISGKQITDPKLLELDKKITKKQVFQREKNLIDKADCIIAEVTKPSLGVGGEIVYALVKDKPVLALVAENHDDLLSPMVAGNPSENLFLEFYHTEKLPFVLKNFLKHVETTKNKKGKLIVIDGGDGSGKTTQTTLLVEYLKKQKLATKYMDFPQYYHSFHGNTVAKFLRGEFGNIDQVSPYLASLAYALDRASVKDEMEDFLKKGGYIIANRYATSNMAHQGAKFVSVKERYDFLKWVYELEYKIHHIPKENIVIYLHVPWKIALNLTGKKGDRKYLAGKSEDIHEKDLNHRIAAEKMYLSLTREYKHWVKIDCVMNGRLLPPDKIQEKIIAALEEKKLI